MYDIWSPDDLYELQQDDRLADIPSYFADTYFSATHFSADKEIIIAELPQSFRVMATYVLPSNQGKPIFKQKGETAKSYLPGYVKPKDPIRPIDMRNRRPSDLRNGIMDLQSKFDARVAEVTAFHVRAIKMLEAWQCARAFIDGKVTIKYDPEQGAPYPEVTIDFGRNANQTVVLSGSYWSDPDYDIIGDLTTWSNRMYDAKLGGRPSVLLVGSSVAPCIQKNNGIRALLSTQIRGGESTTMQLGMLNIDKPMSYIATVGGIGQSIEIWTYKDVVEDNSGTMLDILGPKDVVLIAPGARGVRAYGAIYNVKALVNGEALATDIFPSMFQTDDPGEIYVMHESSPLPIMLTPNKVLKATVLA